MFKRFLLSCLGGMLLLPFATSAQAQITFDGCVDRAGGAVHAVLDTALVSAFETRVESGHPVIRYNPDALPRMQPPTRLFFFAHECARINLGFAPLAARMLAELISPCVKVVTWLIRC